MNSEENLKLKIDKNLGKLFEETKNQNEVICFVHQAIRKYATINCIMLWPCFGLSPTSNKIRGVQESKQNKIESQTATKEEPVYDKKLILDESKGSKNEVANINNCLLSDSTLSANTETSLPEKIASSVIQQEENSVEVDESSNGAENKGDDHIDESVDYKRSANPFTCFICNEKHDGSDNIMKHICNHAGVESSCRTCYMTFRSKTHYEIHKILNQCKRNTDGKKGEGHNIIISTSIDHTNLKNLIICPSCGARFKKPFNLQNHLKRLICTPKTNENELRCKHRCRLNFKTKDDLEKHVKTVHSHVCRICKKIFPTIRDLNLHLPIHKRIHKCDECSEEFTKRELLRLHKKNNHVFEKVKVSYKCVHCTAVFPLKFSLQRHVYREHQKIDPPPVFACDKCPAILKTQGSFNDHLKLHAENNSYFCNVCNRGFKVKMFLKRHLLKHSSTKTYECDRCHVHFKRNDHLRRHVKVMHEGHKSSAKGKPKKPKLNPSKADETSTNTHNDDQFFSLIDVQSGEIFTVPASAYTYNLIFKEQNKIDPPIITNPEQIACFENNFDASNPLPLQQEFPFISTNQKSDGFPIYETESRELCMPAIPDADNIQNINVIPPTFSQNIIPEHNYTECSSSTNNIVVITNVSNLLCMPDMVVNNTSIT